MQKEKYKFQRVRVTVAAAVYGADHRQVGLIDLDKSYDLFDKVFVHRVEDSGAANGDYLVGIADDNGVIHEPTHISSWATAKDDGTAPDERAKSIGEWDVRGAGQLQCFVVMPAQTLATDVLVEFCVRLKKSMARVA